MAARSCSNGGDEDQPQVDRHEELEPILDFVPPVHQLYEQELFPELEFSRRGSAISQGNNEPEEPAYHQLSSFHLPMFE